MRFLLPFFPLVIKKKIPLFVLAQFPGNMEEPQNSYRALGEGVRGRKRSKALGQEVGALPSAGSRHPCWIKPEEAEVRSSFAQAQAGRVATVKPRLLHTSSDSQKEQSRIPRQICPRWWEWVESWSQPLSSSWPYPRSGTYPVIPQAAIGITVHQSQEQLPTIYSSAQVFFINSGHYHICHNWGPS